MLDACVGLAEARAVGGQVGAGGLSSLLCPDRPGFQFVEGALIFDRTGTQLFELDACLRDTFLRGGDLGCGSRGDLLCLGRSGVGFRGNTLGVGGSVLGCARGALGLTGTDLGGRHLDVTIGSPAIGAVRRLRCR